MKHRMAWLRGISGQDQTRRRCPGQQCSEREPTSDKSDIQIKFEHHLFATIQRQQGLETRNHDESRFCLPDPVWDLVSLEVSKRATEELRGQKLHPAGTSRKQPGQSLDQHSPCSAHQCHHTAEGY
ncbi:hypothetical protein Nmel_003556 [Mimus melanotis]